ncbi:uncharacterized protein LOC110932205 [Helianthus annuus]|uniref:uncharacterized protein LOC110932205 n=1 Tax=Helianthus annuus TaxID=4232 RepID=UPI000B900CFA|nr:uncharacterized protein LOC110932205 [Helianthus annuus]
MVFIDLEKPYDSVPRRLIWDSLESRGVSGKYIDLIRDMYVRTETSVRAPIGDTDSFPVEVRLHQGSALSPFLFAVILDELTKLIQEDLPWCLLFADDIMLVADSKMRDNDEDIQITIDGQVVPQVTKFKYLGSFVQWDGEIDSDVAHRIQTCCVIRNRLLGHCRIRNDVFRERLEVASISDKIKEGRLRWFGHVKRWQMIKPVRVVETLEEVEGRKSRGRPKITWNERIRQDLQRLHLSENMVHDRNSWRHRLRLRIYRRGFVLSYCVIMTEKENVQIEKFNGIDISCY